MTYSATDLVNFSACRHLSQLDRLAVLGRLVAPDRSDPLNQLLAAEGITHEHRVLAELRQRIGVTEIASGLDLRAAARTTRRAMVSGAAVIYQGALVNGPWVGRPDFLIRVDAASRWGAWSYEPLDVKLHVEARSSDWVQVAFYARCLEAVQGAVPERIRLTLGGGIPAEVAYAEHREAIVGLQAEFLAAVAGGAATQPEPVTHCGVCRWSEECRRRWVADDHLSLVGTRPTTRTRLAQAGVTSVAELAALPAGAKVGGVAPVTLRRLRSDARLVVEERRTGVPHFRLRYPDEGEGLDAMPPVSPGDLFFDLEGFPFPPGPREYLFGVVDAAGGAPKYLHWWAHDAAGERAALQAFVAAAVARHEAEPNAHVYHYAPYEPRALARLAATHGCCEEEVSRLIDRGVLFDLLPVVRRAVRLSSLRSGLKAVAPFAGVTMGSGEVADGAGSLGTYAAWLADGDPLHLEHLLAYNRTDCVALRGVRDWLVGLARGVRSHSRAQAQYPGGRTAGCGIIPPELLPVARIDDPLARLFQAHRLLSEGCDPEDQECLESLRRRALVAVDFECGVDRPEVARALEMPHQALEELLVEGKMELGLPLPLRAA